MVTVIKDKEELTTSNQNGSVGTTNEIRKNFDFIRDYREVNDEINIFFFLKMFLIYF